MGVLPPSLALYLVIELLELTEQVHQAGVVHGALTPGNVLLGETGQPSVCDFGALRALNSVPALARVFGAKGRAAYRAPEVAAGEAATFSSDVFSLGAIAYELLTLREAVGPKAQSVSVRREAPVPPSRLDRRINSRLDPIVLRAIDPSGGRRFARCAEFSQALRDFLSVSGGMPSREDLARFVADLFPNGVQIDGLGPVARPDPFNLESVEGAALAPQTHASIDLPPRAAFSARSELPPYPPGEDVGTAPGQAGPLERGWHAPSAKHSPDPALGAHAARPAQKRIKISERASQGSLSRLAPAEPSDPREPDPILRTELAMPQVGAPTRADEVPAASSQFATEERATQALSHQRRRYRVIALAIAFVGAFSFSMVVLRFRAPPPKPPDTSAAQVDVALRKFIATVPPPAPIEDKSRPEEPIVWHTPAPRHAAGFLTLSSDLPAIVYVDQQRVRKLTPLKAYPVAPGVRKLAIVDARTGERREFTLTFAKGQLRKLEEQFGARPGKR